MTHVSTRRRSSGRVPTAVHYSALQLKQDTPCSACGFELWEPIAVLRSSKVGLYNDDRFPGRCILLLPEHVESLELLSSPVAMAFLNDIQIAMQAIRLATGAKRVNVAILGNRESHLHAHLIPRFPDSEDYPDHSPWNDPREKCRINNAKAAAIKQAILLEIQTAQVRK